MPSFRYTNKELEQLNKLNQQAEQMRVDAYKNAVQALQKAHEESTTLSKKISRGELKNLIVIQPSKPKTINEFKSREEFENYISRDISDLATEANTRLTRYVDNYIKAIKEAYGDDYAERAKRLIKGKERVFANAINQKQIPSIKFHYTSTYNDRDELGQSVIDDLTSALV